MTISAKPTKQGQNYNMPHCQQIHVQCFTITRVAWLVNTHPG